MKYTNLSTLLGHKICLLLLILIPGHTFAAPKKSVQNFYVQAGIGVGLDSFSATSQDSNGNTTGESLDSIGVQFTGRLHLGVSNIMEIELQQRLGGTPTELTKAGNSVRRVPLDFNFTLFKLNPFPSGYHTDSEPVYLVYGTGGYDSESEKVGDSKIIGLEWAVMSYQQTYRVAIKHVSSVFFTNIKTDMILVDISIAIGY